MAHPSIAIVVTFFGRPPLWLPAFLLSCRKNPDVRWLIYTDFHPPADVPANVTLNRMDVRELDARASDSLGTKVDVQRSLRKACDLKPAYGVIFADDLRPFDFWAHSDLDIIWGDIRHFVTDEMLNAYDIVSSRLSRLSGHFTLFRNTAATNRTFELIPDVRRALATRRYEHLDERELTRHLRDHLAKTPARSAPRVYWHEEWTMSAAYQRALCDSPAHRLWWRDGKTFDAEGRELMYLHFHKLKQNMNAINFSCGDAPTAFTIDRRGFSA